MRVKQDANGVWYRYAERDFIGDKRDKTTRFIETTEYILGSKFDPAHFEPSKTFIEEESDSQDYCLCGQDIKRKLFIKHVISGRQFQVGCVCIREKIGKDIRRLNNWTAKIIQLNAELKGTICTICKNHNRRHKNIDLCKSCEDFGWHPCEDCGRLNYVKNPDTHCKYCIQKNPCLKCKNRVGRPFCKTCRMIYKICEGACKEEKPIFKSDKFCNECMDLFFRKCEKCNVHITECFKSKLPHWKKKCINCWRADSNR